MDGFSDRGSIPLASTIKGLHNGYNVVVAKKAFYNRALKNPRFLKAGIYQWIIIHLYIIGY